MPEPEVKLTDGYSVTKGLKKAFVSTVLPALGVALAGLVLDPGFVQWVQEHASGGAAAGLVTFALFMLQNWAKNRNK
jgi:hypothetical protein